MHFWNGQKLIVNKKRVFILYPCGKKFEIRVPINTLDSNGKKIAILPGQDSYFIYAKEKFQINNLKIIEEEVCIPESKEPIVFISLAKKVRSVE